MLERRGGVLDPLGQRSVGHSDLDRLDSELYCFGGTLNKTTLV